MTSYWVCFPHEAVTPPVRDPLCFTFEAPMHSAQACFIISPQYGDDDLTPYNAQCLFCPLSSGSYVAFASGKPSLISKCLVAFCASLSLSLALVPSLCVGLGYLHTCDVLSVRPRAPSLSLLSLAPVQTWHGTEFHKYLFSEGG